MRAVSPLPKLVRFAAPLLSLCCVLSTWLSSGCGGDTKTTICEDQCSCAGNCNDAATDACVQAITASITLSASKGCDANTYFDCAADKGTCVAGGYNANACIGEKQAFFTCLGQVQCSFQSSTNTIDCITD